MLIHLINIREMTVRPEGWLKCGVSRTNVQTWKVGMHPELIH